MSNNFVANYFQVIPKQPTLLMDELPLKAGYCQETCSTHSPEINSIELLHEQAEYV